MPLLKKGDSVGLVTTSSPITNELMDSLNQTIDLFKNLGLVPVIENHYLEYSKDDRIADSKKRAYVFNNFLKDRRIRAIINLWGGYNSNDLLPLIDWGRLETNKKIIIGASDFTSILNATYTKSKIVSYHWINAIWYGLDRYKKSAETFKRFFLKNSSQSVFTLSHPQIIKNGRSKGVLIGGNLETFERLIGTEYFPPVKNKTYILTIEDVEKPFLKIRSSLQHLMLNNFFKNCSGIILGHFTSAEEKDNLKFDQTVHKLVKKMFKSYDIPIIHSPYIGHEVSNEVLPIGDQISINTFDEEKLCVLN